MSPRQRRGALLVLLAVVAAVVVFASVLQYTGEVSRQLGPRRTVVVVTRDVPAFTAIRPEDLQVRSVPEVFAPPTALGSPTQVTGKVAPRTLPRGALLQQQDLVEPPAVREGQRELTLATDNELSFGGTLAVDDRVDVVVSPESTLDRTPPSWEIPRVLVLGVVTDTDNVPLVVRLALGHAAAVRLAGARAAGASVTLTRISPAEAAS